MDDYKLSAGVGRTKINLSARYMGDDLVVLIHNEQAHIGAVAIADYDRDKDRVSISVVTRLGHKDDAVAQKAAYRIGKHIKKPVCDIAGIHLNKVTEEEIRQIVENSDKLVIRLLQEQCKTQRDTRQIKVDKDSH